MKTVSKNTAKVIFDYNEFKVSRTLMEVDEFLIINAYFKNRDVSSRVDAMVRRLNEGPKPTHLMASIGIATKPFGPYKTGDIFKFDGNTRTEVWKMSPVMRPNVPLFITIYYVSSEEEADEIYYDIDSSASVEKSNDKVTGLLRARGYSAVSFRIKKGSFKTSVENACRYAYDENGLYMTDKSLNHKFHVKLDFFWKELTSVDKMNVDTLDRYSSSILTSLLLVAKKWGCDHPRFKLLFENYRDGVTTISTPREMDGVHFVYHELYTMYNDNWTQSARGVAIPMIGRILYGFEMFMTEKPILKKKNGLPLSEEKFRKHFQEYFK
jgi:hypothetical protein